MDSKIEFLYLDEEDMIESGVMDIDHCVDVMKEVVTLINKKDYIMGGKHHNDHGIQLMFPKKSDIEGFPLEDSRDRRFMSMPAYLGGRFKVAGEKWYGSNGRNVEKGLPRSVLMVTLNDIETGVPIAYMSANLLSAFRTGAMPGLSALYLAKKDAKVLTLLGAGVVNKTCLMAYMAKLKTIDTIKIKGSSATSKTAIAMADFIRDKYPQIKNIIICDTLEEAVRDSDIISEAVSSFNHNWPVIEPKWIKPGCLIISSGTMDMDLNFIKDNVVKVVDNIHMYEEYIKIYQEYDKKTGERRSSGTPGMFFVNMINDGLISRKDVQSLGEIVRGKTPGRKNDDEIILVSVGGMPIEDIAWGYECYTNAIKKGIGTKLKLWNKPHLV